jgi:hypothetical protein
MLIELNKPLKLQVLPLHPQSVLANYLPLPSFLPPLRFQVAVLVSTVSPKLLLQVVRKTVRKRVRKRVRRRRMRVMRVVMAHQEVVIRPRVRFYFIIVISCIYYSF